MDHLISLEEVECMGACSWAPAIQINYDFHHHVTPEKLDQLIRTDSLKPVKPCRITNRTRSKSRCISRRFGLANSASIDTYLGQRRL